MSDPVTNIEIEDVLSSIRRLVSDDGKTPQKTAPAPDALVLTASERVLEPDDAQATDHDEAPVPDQAEDAVEAAASVDLNDMTPEDLEEALEAFAETDDADDEPSLEERLVGMESAFGIEESEWEPEEGEAGPGAEAVPFLTLGRAAQVVTTDDETPAAQARGWSEEELQGGAAEDQLDAETVEVSDDTPSQDPASAEDDGAEEPTLEAEHVIAEVSLQASDVEELDVEPEDDSAEPETAEADAPEIAADDEADAPAADGEIEDAPLEATILGTAAAEEALEAALTDDDFMDEDMLREIVRDIVREELQGAMGERITRNVRKLVRREIHRALTTQGFD